VITWPRTSSVILPFGVSVVGLGAGALVVVVVPVSPVPLVVGDGAAVVGAAGAVVAVMGASPEHAEIAIRGAAAATVRSARKWWRGRRVWAGWVGWFSVMASPA
jgi:hypothetical protein